jgi:hypothetical protein
MGYSCTQDASNALGLLRHAFTDGTTGNGLKIGAFSGFYEVGKEQADGAITGSVFENLPNGFARKFGSFRVNPDGYISRFPCTTRNQRVQLKFRFDELKRGNPSLLSSYSHGVL